MMEIRKRSTPKIKSAHWVNPFRKSGYLSQNYDLYLFLLPALVCIIIFQYLPMYGVQIAFKNFNPLLGVTGSPWVGFEHFIRFVESPYFAEIVRNTLEISLYSLLVGFPAPLILALLLNQLPSIKYRRFIQTVTYAPYFISVVVIVGMLLIFLSPRSGLVNHFLIWLGFEPIHFMAKQELFSTIVVFSDVWQAAGWGAIIYLAALSAISPELHETAMIDGASKLQRIWHIDIPGIMPTVIILLIFNLGSLLSVGFEKIYLMQNSLNIARSEVIPTYVYKVGLQGGQYSFSTAVGVLNNVVNFVLIVAVNQVARKVSSTSLW
ncbi:sugar ABC transporter permease [Paenibacillus sp. J2TS4]|uniref:ABC transporter permease n=1 Tax=Paenibacillus sp. J2TS4 TaxID=2807194 RepID=UPI001B1B1ACA|nr:ABC transporter permease subunit [Paenibacillus sp. J2TS4]GIP36049.1 sugar ABC transporter permease [Paenibacillus sp. J2TS4]